MISNELEQLYFDWIVKKIGGSREHLKLLHRLFDIPFVYNMKMDGNRFEDGLDLRYHFGTECGIPTSEIRQYIDCGDCSLLEMMAAMAIRAEVHIMADDDLGDRTPLWFWHMIESMGLMPVTDDRYDGTIVMNEVDRLYGRAYSHDGLGGLFYVPGTTRDMRTMEYWDQMMVYLNDVLSHCEKTEGVDYEYYS